MMVAVKLAIPGNPVSVAASRDGSRVYVTSSEGKTLSVIDAEERKVVKTVNLKGGPFGVAVHPSGRPVYVTDWFEHRIWVISPDSGEVAAEVLSAIRLPASPSPATDAPS
jgi:YVTN family beta-propeller protein